jgi:hypothetical protein
LVFAKLQAMQLELMARVEGEVWPLLRDALAVWSDSSLDLSDTEKVSA